MAKNSAPFESEHKRMKEAGWGARAIRLLFNNGIVDDVNEGRMTITEGEMHYPAIKTHPCLNKARLRESSRT